MNEMQVFQNSEFGELGVLEVNGKPYFPAKAAAKILGYKDTTNAIKQHCKGVVKHHLPTNGGVQTMNFIPEGDLYRQTSNPEAGGHGHGHGYQRPQHH